MDEFRIEIAQTFAVIVEPREERAHTVFAESMDRSGYARGTLAPRTGMTAEVPRRRQRPVLTMADMGMDHGTMPGVTPPAAADTARAAGHAGHDMAAMAGTGAGDAIKYAVAGAVRTEGLRPPGTVPEMLEHERSTHGPGNAAVPMMVRSRVADPGLGLGEDGWRVLRYVDLRALKSRSDFRAPDREIEMHLTGNMERFMWSIDGVAFKDAAPIPFAFGERIRLTMVNDTMMNHPMHLHGMWMELENGHGEMIPRLHTVNVKPAERLSLLITADAPGMWAFHCHILNHMEVGMFRVIEVATAGERTMREEPGDDE